MARPTRIPSRRLPESVRRRLEIATAMAWEALVDRHVLQANEFVQLMEQRLELEDALARYLAELDLDETMSAAVRTRVLVGLEQDGDGDDDATLRLPEPSGAEAPPPQSSADDGGWRRFRPDVVLRDVRRRQRESDETDNMIALALARAEEGIMQTHVDNAISFTALLGDYVGMGRAVQYYLGAVMLSGSRAHSVFQRTMARLADVHLPR